ncbi:ZIP family metal transporter [Candidatus Azambacteria bacterium]|nr:ZIP family metal transporter [Candidatus Azambacteria bacterium]
MLIFITIATFLSTLLGGLIALRFKDKLHLVLGFSAGAIIAVAFFEMLPEAIELGGSVYNASLITSMMGLGFLIYLVLDRMIILHSHAEENGGHSIQKGFLGAGSLSFHSFLDGVAIGLAFQVSTAVGLVIATAVLVHDFSDGINTANLVLKNGGSVKMATRWVATDALAPVLGVLSTSFFTLSSTTLALFLAIFSGFFFYIGAVDLLPESHHRHPTILTTVMTIIGMAVLYGVIKIAG